MTTSNEHNNAPAATQGVPEINYPALIEAAFAKNRKWTQGTTGCIAFARGAEWFREQAIAATPTPPATEQAMGMSKEQFGYALYCAQMVDAATAEIARLRAENAELQERIDATDAGVVMDAEIGIEQCRNHISPNRSNP